MKTIKQIQKLAENIAACTNSKDNVNLINSVRDNFLPLFQFNIDATSSEKAQTVFNKVSENILKSSFVAYLPDGQHTYDKVGNMVLETPTIMEWQGG